MKKTTRPISLSGHIIAVALAATGIIFATSGCHDKDYDAAMAPVPSVKMKVFPPGNGPTMGGVSQAGGGGGGSAPSASPSTK